MEPPFKIGETVAKARNRIGRVGVLTSRALNDLSVPPELPAQPRADDLFVVEFPKSGITWLSFMMANVNLLLSGDQTRRVTLFNLIDFIPEVGVNRFIGPPATSVPGFRIIKSHSTYSPHFSKILYLVRDPRDVMPSFHRFLMDLGAFNGSLEDLISSPEQGISSWSAHVSGWFDQVQPTQSFAFIRYEDLLAEPIAQLRDIYQLMGIGVSDEVLQEASERSSLARMRDEEVLFRKRHPALKKLEFVRREKVSGPRETLPNAIRQKIESDAGPVMKRLGYLE